MLLKYVVDTSTLLRIPGVVSKYECVITAPVLRELEKHKLAKDENLRYQAREATRVLIDSNVDVDLRDYTFSLNDEFDPQYNDNKLLQACINNGHGLITDDLLLRLKAKGFGIQLIVPQEQELYTGYMDVCLSDEELALVYECPTRNSLGLYLNQYLIVRNSNGNVKDTFKWTGDGLVKCKKKSFKSKWAVNNTIKARNIEQELYIDMLHDPDTKVKAVSGPWGTGKDLIALNYFLGLVDSGRYKRMLWIRNNVEAKGTQKVGYLPGDIEDKLSPYAELIGDIVGEQSELDKLVKEEKIKLIHTGYLRGRNFENSILYCSEAQNASSELMGLIISRAAESSVVFLNGDIVQVDGNYGRTNNGLYSAIEAFKGLPNFAHVQLKKVERSEAARMASLLR